jgi:hypothetical protein
MKSINACAIAVLAMFTALPASYALAADSSIRVSDLVGLRDDQLDALQAPEFAALRAEVAYEGAKLNHGRLQGYVGEAKERRKVAQLNVKAAQSESEAAERERRFRAEELRSPVVGQVQERARAGQPDRHLVARTRLERSEVERRQADLYLEWRARELKAADAFVDVTRERAAVADLERDIRRVGALSAAGAPASQKYDARKLDKKLASAQAKLGKRDVKFVQLRDAADMVREQYARISDDVLPLEQPPTT